MPKAKKLPSGSWRCRVYLGDEYVNGKRKQIVESVTVDIYDTPKMEYRHTWHRGKR